MSESEISALSGLTDELHTIYLSDSHGNHFYMPMPVDIDVAVDKAQELSEQGYRVIEVMPGGVPLV